MTQPPQPPALTLDYQRLDRARKTAIGGLRLLGILTAIAAMALFALVVSEMRSRFGFSLRFLLPLGIFASAFILGMLKFICAMLIARRSKAAAMVALFIVLIESLGLGYLLYQCLSLALHDSLDPSADRLRFVMLLISLLGWLAVAYEILHVIRHEQRP
jgi:hypothetical protein